jgi:hypothetical protein
MADESSDVAGRSRRARLRFLLAAISCIVFLAFLVLLTRAASEDPLKPLRDVRFSAIGVGINFLLALGSVAAFSYWRRLERNRAARRGER